MTKRWVRGIPCVDTFNGANRYARTCKSHNLYLFNFLHRILGWALLDEGKPDLETASSWSWETNWEHTGTDGVLIVGSGTQAFNGPLTAGYAEFQTSVATDFVAGDAGTNRALVIVDNTNPSNSGIYPIVGYNANNSIVIDMLTADNDAAYPIAQGSLSWWLIDAANTSDSNDPRVGDFFVLNVPHATSPYTLHMRWAGNTAPANDPYLPSYTYNSSGLTYQWAPGLSQWNAGTNDWNTGVVPSPFRKVCPSHLATPVNGRFYAMGDTDGSHWMTWGRRLDNTTMYGGGISVLDALESSPTLLGSELIHIWGMATGANTDTNQWKRSIFDGIHEMGFGYVMPSVKHIFSNYGLGNAQSQKYEVGYWMGWYETANATDIFRPTVGVNNRTGKYDALPISVQVDPENARDHWYPLGDFPTDSMFISTAVGVGDRTNFDTDLFHHIKDGVCIPWPGLPHPFAA